MRTHTQGGRDMMKGRMRRKDMMYEGEDVEEGYDVETSADLSPHTVPIYAYNSIRTTGPTLSQENKEFHCLGIHLYML